VVGRVQLWVDDQLEWVGWVDVVVADVEEVLPGWVLLGGDVEGVVVVEWDDGGAGAGVVNWLVVDRSGQLHLGSHSAGEFQIDCRSSLSLSLEISPPSMTSP